MARGAESPHSQAGAAAQGAQARRPRPRLRQGPVLRVAASRARSPAPARTRCRPGFEGGQMPIDMRHRRSSAATRPRTRCRSGRSGPTASPSTCATSRSASPPGEAVTPEALKAKGLIAKVSRRRQDPRRRRADEEARGLRARLLAERAREDRGRRWHDHLAARRARAQAVEEGRGPKRRRGAAAGRRGGRPAAEAAGRRRRTTEVESEYVDVQLARERLACPGAPQAPPLHRVRARRLPARIVDPGAGRRRRARSRATSTRQGGGDLHPAQHVLGRRALAVLAVRARDHAVRHGVDHRPAPHRRHPPAAELQKEGEAGYAKINQYTRYLTVVLAAAPGARLRLPLQEPERERRRGARRERRPHDPDHRARSPAARSC